MNVNVVTYDLLDPKSFKDYLKKKDVKIELEINDETVEIVTKRANVLLDGSHDDRVRAISIEEDVIGHVLLRGIASLNEKIEKWFINNEALLLRDRFLLLSSLQRLRVLRQIFGRNRVLTIREFLDMIDRDEQWLREELNILHRDTDEEHFVMNWEIVYRTASRHKCRLYAGWAFMRADDVEIGRVFMNAIRALLQVKIHSTSLPDGTKEALLELEESILSGIEQLSGTVVGYDDITKQMGNFPLCIRLLDLYLVQGKDLGHQEMLQLGFFLKSIGFTLEDYRKYFYYRHPANEGKSYDEFVRSHWGGYQLKHHYGEVGGGKDYSSFKCETIVKEGFCPFADLNGTQRRKLIEEIYGELRDEHSIKDLTSKMNAKLKNKTPFNCEVACAMEFSFRFSDMYDGTELIRIKNPVNYYRLADRIINGKIIDGERIVLKKKKKGDGNGKR